MGAQLSLPEIGNHGRLLDVGMEIIYLTRHVGFEVLLQHPLGRCQMASWIQRSGVQRKNLCLLFKDVSQLMLFVWVALPGESGWEKRVYRKRRSDQ